LSFTQASSDARDGAENSGELLGKAQSTTPHKHRQPIIIVAFAKVEDER